jgi:hypothetical protein
MKEIIKLEELNLPFDELTLTDDEMLVVKGAAGIMPFSSGSGCNCGCSTSTGSGCHCGCTGVTTPA